MQREQLVAIKLKTIIFNALFSITASPFNSFLCNGGLMLSSWGHTGRMIRSDKYFYLIIKPETMTQLVWSLQPCEVKHFCRIGQTRSKIHYLSIIMNRRFVCSTQSYAFLLFLSPYLLQKSQLLGCNAIFGMRR